MFDLKLFVALKPHVFDSVDARGSAHSQIICRDLERYYVTLALAREQLLDKLALNEIGLILESLQGKPMHDPGYVRLLWADIESDIRHEALGDKWLVDGESLVETLTGLSFIERCALADAAERWWERLRKGERPDLSEALA